MQASSTSRATTCWPTPGSTRYQQSNPWLTETLALAAPGARVGMANVAFVDHPDDKRWSDRIETTTADSVLAWVRRAGLAASPGAPVVRVP